MGANSDLGWNGKERVRPDRLNSQRSAIGTAKKFWRYFIFAWAIPLVLIGSIPVLDWFPNPQLGFIILVVPIFFACFHIASKPIRSRKASIGHGVLWVVVVPILSWFLVISGFFLLAHTLGVLDAQ